MPHFAVTAIGRDRPGIVAALTGALHDLGGNLEDVSSTILRGHFTMMLVVDAPRTADELRDALRNAGAPLDVAVTVSDVDEGAPDRPGATHVVSVYGSDHPGIVAGIAEALAGAGVNIIEMTCRLTTAEPPVYAMVAEVSVPGDADPERLAAQVSAVGASIGVDVSLSPIDVETL